MLERGRTGQTWRDRWDSFCLVSPNWTVQLPDHPYDGDDPDGYMSRDEIVAYLGRYRDALGLPVREGVGAVSVEQGPLNSGWKRPMATSRPGRSSWPPAHTSVHIARPRPRGCPPTFCRSM